MENQQEYFSYIGYKMMRVRIEYPLEKDSEWDCISVVDSFTGLTVYNIPPSIFCNSYMDKYFIPIEKYSKIYNHFNINNLPEYIRRYYEYDKRDVKRLKKSKKGYIYFISCDGMWPDRDYPVKIGFSNNPEKRLNSLQTGNPNQLKLIDYTYDTLSQEVETWLHWISAAKHFRGEWYSISKCEIEYLLHLAFDIQDELNKV
jgi:hypothetical protein